MDQNIRRLTVDELIHALDNGDVSERQLAELPGLLGAGARQKQRYVEKRWTWPQREVFIEFLAKALYDVAWPPEQSQVAARMPCDPKTLQNHIEYHLGPKTWREFLGYLMHHSLQTPSSN